MKNARKTVKRFLAVILTVIMTLSCFSAGLSFIASAAEWVHVGDQAYTPVTVYVQDSTMTAGETYLVAIGTNNAVLLSNSFTPSAPQTRHSAGATDYYTKSGNNYSKFNASNYYILDETNSAYPSYEFEWRDGKALYNAEMNQYVTTNRMTSSPLIMGDTYWNSWSYSTGSSFNVIQSTYYGTNYKLRLNDGKYSLYTSTADATCNATLYKKMTVYKHRVGGYYNYNGQKEFFIEKGQTFDESVVLDAVSVLYRETEDAAEYDILTISDSRISLQWNQTVNTAVEGAYTAKVLAEGTEIATVTVYVTGEGPAIVDTANDPSTSDLRSKFPGVESDDGKILTDKTVQYGDDEFNAFSTYEQDEFSIALSALGQSYKIVETEETEVIEKMHPDVVFVLDASGSMREYKVAGSTTVTRGEGTAKALNAAIKALYEADPETRIGIVTYNNDYNDVGVYLPLDKYTLPEGQTDYILWGKRNYATGGSTTAPSGSIDLSNLTTELSPVVSKSISGTTYFYPATSTTSTTSTTSQLRYQINTSGRVRRYKAGSSSYDSTLSSGLTAGNYVTDTNNNYVIYRGSNNTYYIYDRQAFEDYCAAHSSVLSYDVRTVSSSKTVTITTSSTNAVDPDDGFNRPSDVTELATVNGHTYYAFFYSTRYSTTKRVYVYRDDQQSHVASLNEAGESYVDENITITRSSNSSTASVTYTTNSYEKRYNATIQSETQDYLMSTNFLINSKGKVVRPSSYKFLTNMGTYTQAGLQAAENMFMEYAGDDLSHRIPAIVLISDGIPTISNSNVNNPSLHASNGVTTGYGFSTASATTSDVLSTHGVRVIQTGMKVKKNVDALYKSSEGNTGTYPALFYSIGPGVDYIFGQTVLDPTQENVDAAMKVTTADTDSESGVGVPRDLANKIVSVLGSGQEYVDYVDWSYTGDMTLTELTDSFMHIVENLSTIYRPVKSVTMNAGAGEVFDESAGMKFVDTIGDGMEVRDEFVISYGGKTYRPTDTTISAVDGRKTYKYKYDYNVIEASTGKTYSLGGISVNLIEKTDATTGKVTYIVEWYIPTELVPIIHFNEKTDKYVFVDPIGLVYKVGIADKSDGGSFYTNSVENPATSEYTPTVGNPYYYDNEEGEDGKIHSTLKDDFDKTINKKENVTDTLPYAWDIDLAESGEGYDNEDVGKVYTKLGNNGVESLSFTQVEITKIWEDSNDLTGQRPDHISVQVYKDGDPYRDPEDIYAEDCETYVDENGNDVWHVVIDDLPFNDSYAYEIREVEIKDHDTYITRTSAGGAVITNTLRHGTISYELYLVDKNGTPIDEDGNVVSFTNRTEMSELVEIEAYINRTTVIDLDELEKLLPDGYYLYNPETSYSETFMGAGSKLNTASVDDNAAGTTKVFYPSDASIDENGNVSGLGDFSDVRVAFAILKMSINPDVVVVDYGKTIVSSPLDNDNGDFVINGILSSVPKKGVNTVSELKLNNGVAAVEYGDNNNVDLIVPQGRLVIPPFTPTATTYMYPSTGAANTTNVNSLVRYRVTTAGVVSKLAAGSNTETVLGTLASSGDYLFDEDYIIYRSRNSYCLATDYKFDIVDTVVEVPTSESYYELDGTTVALASNVSVSNYSSSPTTVGTFPDGGKLTAYYSGNTITFADGSKSYTLASAALITTFSHTLPNSYRDKNGNNLVIQCTISRASTTSKRVTVTYTGFKSVQETKEETITESTLKTRVYGQYDTVTYTPFKYMSSIDRLYYCVNFANEAAHNTDSGNLLYSSITFIPATIVYYEDDFGGSAENGGLYIQYSGDWYTVTDDGTKTSGVTANTDTDDRQDRGEVGQGHVPYGYDSSYDDCVKFSNGSASFAAGSVSLVNGRPQFDATAKFTYTGTGFDIISRTDLDCGYITVLVKDHATGGKEYSDTASVDNKGVNNLYQIPVISYKGHPYGTYDVTINVCAPVASLGATGSNFYLDAIRIYNPMGLESSDNVDFDEANAAYNADKEANAITQLIRDFIISADELDPAKGYYTVYVDTIDNNYESGGKVGNIKSPEFTSEEKRTRAIDFEKVQNLQQIGPNQEIYLSPNNGIGFVAESAAIPEAVHLEMKLPLQINNGATLVAQTYGDTKTMKNITINSATEMYYDITDAVKFVWDGDAYRATVILSNGIESNTENDIISITNIKMTYADGTIVNGGFTEDAAGSEIVTASFKATPDTYVQAYDTLYVQQIAAAPNYDIVNAEAEETVAKGETVTLKFNTANSVEDVNVIANGEEVELTSLSCEVDESKLYTDDFQNAKSWTATFKAEDAGEFDYTVEAANGEGEKAELKLKITPARLERISVAAAPAKTDYRLGEKIDTTGLVLEGKYTDGSVKAINSGYELSSNTANRFGKKTVKVSYSGLKTSFDINVKFDFKEFIFMIFTFAWLWMK